jgi:hyperosmotically inducible protein
MNVSLKGLIVVFSLAAVLSLAACKQEGQAEKAGQKVDQAVEQSGKKIDQAVEQAGKKIEKAKDNIDDTAITAKIKVEIANDPLLKVSQITVSTTNGVVRLSGVVDSQKSIDRALEITRANKNVQSTENALVVKSAN